MADTTRDELEIRTLVARYADAVNQRDADAWSATWTDDGEWHVFGKPTSGREAVRTLWQGMMGGIDWVIQLPYGGILDLAGEEGSGRWYITEHLKLPDGSATLSIGHYHDRYRRVRGEWLFSRRRFDVLYMGPPDLSGAVQPFPRDL